MKTTSKKKPFIIPVFIPHAGCPHQCVFCNQSVITGVSKKQPTADELRLTIEGFLKYKKPERYPVQISFYGGTFLGLDPRYIEMALGVAGEYVKTGAVDSIRFSTRPDSMDRHRMKLLESFPVKTIEVGVQSMDKSVLEKSGRGHTAEDTEAAVALLKEGAYEVGLQMMAGLPGDNEEKIFKTAQRISSLKPDFVRIYPAVVLRGSPLEHMYENGEYVPLSLNACVSVVKKLYLFFSQKKIRVIRLGLQSTEDFEQGTEIIAGPYHPAFGHMVISDLFLDMARLLSQKLLSDHGKQNTLTFKVHGRDISKMRGLKNCNIEVLKSELNLESVAVIPDDSVLINSLKCENVSVDIESLYYSI